MPSAIKTVAVDAPWGRRNPSAATHYKLTPPVIPCDYCKFIVGFSMMRARFSHHSHFWCFPHTPVCQFTAPSPHRHKDPIMGGVV